MNEWYVWSCIFVIVFLRSQDKGFHVESGLNHIFTRSYPYTTPGILKMEAALAKDTISFELPEELSEYVNRYERNYLYMT